MPDGSAVCDHTLKHAPFTMTKDEWDVARIGWVSEPSDWFAENKAAIKKLCHETKECIERVIADLVAKVERMRAELARVQ